MDCGRGGKSRDSEVSMTRERGLFTATSLTSDRCCCPWRWSVCVLIFVGLIHNSLGVRLARSTARSNRFGHFFADCICGGSDPLPMENIGNRWPEMISITTHKRPPTEKRICGRPKFYTSLSSIHPNEFSFCPATRARK